MAQHHYEKTQGFNAVTRFLHARRYRTLSRIARDLAPGYGPRLRVLDIGCGPASAFRALNELRDDIDYTGVELRRDFCDLATERYTSHQNFRIHCASIADRLELIGETDLIIGMESFEHIPEPVVQHVVRTIGASDFGRLYVTVPNEIGPAVAIKNTGSALMGYVRHHEYTWRETFFASIYRLDRVKPHGVQHIGFDWRALARTLRGNLRIIRTFTSPWQAVPRAVSPSIGFLCERRR